MATIKRLLFTVVVICAIVCNFFAVFSIAWVTDWSGSIGLFPLWDITIGWYIAASSLMYVSFLCSVLVFIQLIITSNNVRKNGYSHLQRGKFISIAVFSLLITVSTAVAVILIAVNLPHMNKKYYDNATLGYSAWFSVAGAVFYLVVAGFSISYARVECSFTKSQEPCSII
ncbi:DNA damage-regulated autophagy modulator protein 2 [Caenorhabditis elegans]|uniref:DNA damage-regulated autophagy modulator protein 2 n=1 Tax=Caenorhabditis elegans TaxID=6239 RepID=G5EBZ7_CAEEL|nr:DNA damage-regulated autophagy modulator protein 2 [Caenorhabditis elegans]CAB04448.1 DNA damage-regulated autophagy modulator protein 2 [Caenorhabditis elegans]|eukprot:NP_507304.1 Uncharacterized protein CELE_F49H6.13 [Caenorhabditis elegans]